MVSTATWEAAAHFHCDPGSAGGEARTPASAGLGLAGSDPRATPPPTQKAAGAPTPESGPSGVLEAVLASAAPCRPQSARARRSPVHGRDHRGQALHSERGPGAAATLRSAPGWLHFRRKRKSVESKGIFSTPKKGKRKVKPCHSTPAPPKMVSQAEATTLFQKVHPAEKSRMHRSSADFSEI